MKQLLVKKGKIIVEQVPTPVVDPNHVLVKVAYSCISPGTEMTTVKGSGEPLYKRLIKKPEYLKKVYDLIKEKGLVQAKSLLKGKVEEAYPIGYSASGIVVAVGQNVTGFLPGDKVACAGAGHANHAEYIDVPVNLVVKLSDSIDLAEASTVTLGAIALQGVRRTNPTIGERIVVFGLGILGQLTVQLLKNNGCTVIGIDVDQHRVNMALKNGMDIGINAIENESIERVLKLTDNFGADAVIITAAASGDSIIDQAMKMCRKKGRVVLVGSVSLALSREDFYKKEIDFLISTSYGPGRYDDTYEEEGIDYPFAYVRWTENRNMEEYLRLVQQKRILISDYVNGNFTVNDAPEVYENLVQGKLKDMLIILAYPFANEQPKEETTIQIAGSYNQSGIINIAVIGAGGFAKSTHLPNINHLFSDFSIHTILNRNGSNAVIVAKQFGAKNATTNYREVLNDEEVGLVLICTRHDLHANMTIEALRSGKHVFVEKPLAINDEELREIEAFYHSNVTNKPLLMTGFNRRFSEAAVKMKKIIERSTTPLIINYRMNAGFIAPEFWVHRQEGGGRNIGEACHIYDLFNFLTGDRCESIVATAIDPTGKQWNRNDNFVAVLKYQNGSVCTLTYTSMGDKSVPKEICDIYFDGQILEMKDFKEVIHYSSKRVKILPCNGKGHLQELEALRDTLVLGKEWPISLEEQFSATRISFEVENKIFNR
jgi:predicted dehydrogenase/threonine dehydrogenase-like Zn-dependent dehydrogenase